nr:MAG TPA: hypothetical protein [Caudoviricetes sp.]
MIYEYYTPVFLGMHALFSKELAEIFSKKYGWTTANNKIPYKFITAFLKREENNDPYIHIELYHKTRYGLSRVYLNGLKYLEKCAKKLEKNQKKWQKEIRASLEIDGVTFNLKKKGSEESLTERGNACE